MTDGVAEVAARHGSMVLYRETAPDGWGCPIWRISYGDGRGISGPLLGGRLLALHHWRLMTEPEYADAAVAMFADPRADVAPPVAVEPVGQLSLLEGGAA